MIPQRPPVVVLGLSLTGLNVVRSFASRRLHVIAADCEEAQVGFRSRYGRKILVASPEEAPEQVVEQLVAVARRERATPILMPTTDRFVQFTSRHRQALAQAFRFHLAEPGLVEAVIDKAAFAQLMTQHSIPSPRTWRLNGRLPLPDVRVPCVVKPAISYALRNGRNGKGWVIQSLRELELLRRSAERSGCDLILQELIPGADDQHYSYAAYLSRGGELRGAFVSRKLRQFPMTLGIGCLCESRWEPEVAALGLRTLQAIGFHGLAEVEIKRDARSGSLVVLEINARSWMQNALASTAGVDLDFLAYADLAGLLVNVPPKQTDGVKWWAVRWDAHAAGAAIRARQLSVRSWWRSLRGIRIVAYWHWRDPLPGLAEFWRLPCDVARGIARVMGLTRRTESPSATGGSTSPRILTTYPIPESEKWQQRTAFMASQTARGVIGWLNRALRPLGFRDIALPWRLWQARRSYDVIITGAEREDCCFALLQALLPGRRTPHLMMCCLWKRERNPLRAWCKRALLQCMSRSVTRFIVWSTQEIDHYATAFGIERRQFVFLPHHATLNGYAVAPATGEYVFAGGDSSRDYATLLDAVRPLGMPVVIASRDPLWKQRAAGLSHVRVEAVSPQRFRELMAGARVVVVPLERGMLQAAGHQTYLNAMQLRKPVIVSEAPGVRDHLRHGETGWIVPAGDVAALREAIVGVFHNGAAVSRIVEQAFVSVTTQFTLEYFVERNLALAAHVSRSSFHIPRSPVRVPRSPFLKEVSP